MLVSEWGFGFTGPVCSIREELLAVFGHQSKKDLMSENGQRFL
jgi:hypothetical protein